VRTTVLIVDDHEGFRESACALLEAEGFAVVGDAADGAAAIVEVARLRPEVALWTSSFPTRTASRSLNDWQRPSTRRGWY
jgi:DNA-binding NarL/FixJ family response regulator